MRSEFAEFLRRVAAHTVGPIEWQRFIVTHYQDEFLETARRAVAELCTNQFGGKEWSEAEFAALQHWSRELKRDSAA
jgi:hypothetical protein